MWKVIKLPKTTDEGSSKYHIKSHLHGQRAKEGKGRVYPYEPGDSY